MFGNGALVVELFIILIIISILWLSLFGLIQSVYCFQKIFVSFPGFIFQIAFPSECTSPERYMFSQEP